MCGRMWDRWYQNAFGARIATKGGGWDWVAMVVVLCGGIGGGIAWHWLWVQCNVLDRQQQEQKTLVCCKVAVGPFFI